MAAEAEVELGAQWGGATA
uniref:Uncharacterized protein n=2 Tax=Oryza sativa subsp. japonica TaxID=39947 RepID=Q2R7D4_ORYSJ|nr:hypothetical protein [Oryza sativa Japonica Group]AAX94946.1 hypothetical protein LOC_Os11g16980 [Oryza sativa Japonica Group]ABA92657.1 hypothetical protein LOC_Os11g16979 [Oryza sativa Japonica Group]